MASFSIFSHALCIVLLLVSRAETASSQAAPSPSSSLPAADCMSELLSLSGCLPYVQAGSTVAKPDSSCCSPLKKVVKEKPACLCQAFSSGSTFGLSLNMTKALSLPSACNVKTPSVSNCKLAAAGSPLGAPGMISNHFFLLFLFLNVFGLVRSGFEFGTLNVFWGKWETCNICSKEN